MSDEQDLADLRTIADYQFGAGAGEALFPPAEPLQIRRSTSGRPRQVIAPRIIPADAPESGDGGTVGAETKGTSVVDADEESETAGVRLVSYGTDGRFTLGFAGGARLHRALPHPAYRVAVGDESEPFVRDGKNTFAKFVTTADQGIRPGDEVLVVHEETDDLLAVGRAELSGEAMLDFDSGMAVKVREGADES